MQALIDGEYNHTEKNILAKEKSKKFAWDNFAYVYLEIFEEKIW